MEKGQDILNRLEKGESCTQEDELDLNLLKQSIEKLTNEIQNYMQREEGSAKTQQTVEKLFEVQFSAEEIMTRLQARIKTVDHPNEVSPHQPRANQNTRLPELKIRTFDGNILKWHGFWDQFSSIIGNRKLDDVDKMIYLRDSLQGDALEVIQGLELTNANYKIAVSRLTKTFGRPGHVVDMHYRALTATPKATSDISSCRRTLNKLEGHLSILESMGEKIEANNSLRSVILDKFPNELMFNFRMGEETDNQPIQSIRQHLEQVISSREMSMPRQVTGTADTFDPLNYPTSSVSHLTTESL